MALFHDDSYARFGRKGIITIFGMTLCAILGVFHVDVAVITCIAGMVAVFNGADSADARGRSKVKEAEASASGAMRQVKEGDV